MQKRASEFYSGKKKKYTQKAQIVIDYSTTEILSVDFSGGRTHDFKLFKQSNLPLSECTCVLADKGYQGIKKIHYNSLHPIKRRKKVPFTDSQRAYNLLISRLRFVIERVNGILKRFRILSSKYRNAPQTFIRTFLLVCGLHNFQHHMKN